MAGRSRGGNGLGNYGQESVFGGLDLSHALTQVPEGGRSGNVVVQGLRELLAAMQELPREVVSRSGGPLKRALAKAMIVIRDEARVRAPKRTGLLASEIVGQRSGRPRDYGATEQYRVGVRHKQQKYGQTKRNRQKGRVGKEYAVEGDAYYGRFIELGTEKMPAQPFLRPAFEAKKGEAFEAFVRELDAGIQKAARKVARQRAVAPR